MRRGGLGAVVLVGTESDDILWVYMVIIFPGLLVVLDRSRLSMLKQSQ